jgi:hypothetical protein
MSPGSTNIVISVEPRALGYPAQILSCGLMSFIHRSGRTKLLHGILLMS